MRLFFLFLCVSFSLFAMPHVPVAIQNEEQLLRAQEIQSLRLQAQKHIENEEFNKAISLFKEVEEKDQKGCEELWRDCLLEKAHCEIKLDHLKKALKTLEILDLNELNKMQRFSFRLMQSKVFLETNQTPEALDLLLQVLNEMPLAEWPLNERPYLLYARSRSLDYYQKLREVASIHLENSNFAEAYKIYQNITGAIEKGVYQFPNSEVELEFFYQMAGCEFSLELYEQAISRLEILKQGEGNPWKSPSLYLLIQAHQRKGDAETALRYCSEYLREGPFDDELERGLVELEEAKIYLSRGEYERAEELLLMTLEKKKLPVLVSLAEVYLARLYMGQKKLEKAKSYLVEESNPFDPSSQFSLEWYFAKGELFFYFDDFEEASRYYHDVLSKKSSKKTSWWPIASYHSSYCNYKLGQKKNQDKIRLKSHLSRAEKQLKELLRDFSLDECYELLAHVYALKIQHLGDAEAREALIALAKSKGRQSPEVQQKIAFLSLQAYEQVESKLLVINHLLNNTQDPKWRHSLLKVKIRELQTEGTEGLHHEILGAIDELWEHSALLSFEEFQDLLASTLELYLKGSSQHELKQALEFMEHLESKFSENKASAKALYLSYQKAVLIAQFLSEERAEQRFPQALEALEKILKYSSDDNLKEQSYLLLGSLYLAKKMYGKAKGVYLHFLQEFPLSQLTSEVLYWLAECAQGENLSPKEAREYRKRIFTQFPSSPYAYSAYFAYFPFSEYEKGNQEALEHLKTMEELFPNSSFLILSRFLRGLQSKKHYEDALISQANRQKELHKALTLFEGVKQLFLKKLSSPFIETEAKSYLTNVFFKAELSRADLLQSLADSSPKDKRAELMAQALEINRSVLEKLEEKSAEGEGLPYSIDVFRQACFQVAKSLIKTNDVLGGQRQLWALLKEGTEVEPHYYVSKAWYELAQIAYIQENFQGALESLDNSFKSADNRVTEQELIEIGIQQSLCYRALGEYDQAILALSEIINTRKNSTLKVKAMLFRADLYALQGRRELAQKQLQEAAQKGGDWGKMAQNRLVAEYGIY